MPSPRPDHASWTTRAIAAGPEAGSHAERATPIGRPSDPPRRWPSGGPSPRRPRCTPRQGDGAGSWRNDDSMHQKDQRRPHGRLGRVRPAPHAVTGTHGLRGLGGPSTHGPPAASGRAADLASGGAPTPPSRGRAPGDAGEGAARVAEGTPGWAQPRGGTLGPFRAGPTPARTGARGGPRGTGRGASPGLRADPPLSLAGSPARRGRTPPAAGRRPRRSRREWGRTGCRGCAGRSPRPRERRRGPRCRR